jgi:hypothetical protein
MQDSGPRVRGVRGYALDPSSLLTTVAYWYRRCERPVYEVLQLFFLDE